MKNKLILACDSGKKGGIVVIDLEGRIVSKQPLFVDEDNDYELDKIRDYILPYKNDIVLAAVEKVHSIFGTGKSTAFKMGHGLGIIEGILTGLEIPFLQPTPKTWQKISWGGIPRSKDTKQTSVVAASMLFPDEKFIATKRSRKPHDGLVDAALIAYYTLTKLNESN